MNIEIIRQKNENGYKVFEMACGKKQAYILERSGSKNDYVNVICQNDSHRAWKGMGRIFRNFDEAIEGYKSSEMKAMINFAKNN